MKLALLGDIALFGNLSILNNANYKEYFKDVAEWLSKMDYVVGNFETPFSIKKKSNGAKSAYICSDIENVEILRYLHIDAVTLANNHMFDYGKEGYETTKEILSKAKIDFFGTEGKQLKKKIDNNLLSFSGFCCYSTNPLECVPNGQYGVNEFDVGAVKRILEDDKTHGYLSILAIHAGLEHVNYPSLDTIKIARRFAEDNNYIYYGHHPHVVQGIEQRNKSLIAYSLGNFCFDDVYTNVSDKPLIELSENNRSSCILEINIENNKIVSYNIIPIYIGKDKMYINRGTSQLKVNEYMQPIINMSSEDYQKMRNDLISQYLQSRKKRRNFMWYVKRLRYRYFKIILNAKQNNKKYQNCVSKYI